MPKSQIVNNAVRVGIINWKNMGHGIQKKKKKNETAKYFFYGFSSAFLSAFVTKGRCDVIGPSHAEYEHKNAKLS